MTCYDGGSRRAVRFRHLYQGGWQELEKFREQERLLQQQTGEEVVTIETTPTKREHVNRPDRLPWHAIKHLRDKYQSNLLLKAPELVNVDFNEHGIGMGYWQDDWTKGCGSFLACKWSPSLDKWLHVPCTPTHFIVLGGR